MQERFLYRPSEEGSTPPPKKRLGGYLVEAGLLTPAQVDVVLNDQKMTGMRFGEILAARGWVKQQTIEYLMQKVILPEQDAVRQRTEESAEKERVHNKQLDGLATPHNAPHNNGFDEANGMVRRELPITKPLPSVATSDEDVSWVG
ncbi:MAG: hypothetical protein NW224_15365 [Leptolyngbyaceae cyanobacterium bins.302]|nr:hypothetical protein [Leptolyngbyaceae cyanobacterium bins.302]